MCGTTYFNNSAVNRTLSTLPEFGDMREKTFFSSRNIPSLYYNIKSAEERLAKYVVSAPYAGSISEVYQDIGSITNPGAKVMRIIRTDKLELELPIRKEDVQWITAGTRVKILTEDESVSTSGRVLRIGKLIDSATQSVNAYISIRPKRSMKFYEGMYLKGVLDGRSVGKAMEAPRRAVLNGNRVFVLSPDSLLTQKNVNVLKFNTETLLFSGLEEGELLVIEPSPGISEGMKVRPIQD